MHDYLNMWTDVPEHCGTADSNIQNHLVVKFVLSQECMLTIQSMSSSTYESIWQNTVEQLIRDSKTSCRQMRDASKIHVE